MPKTQEISRNLGGNRLGSGSKNNIDLHAYNRSTHDLTRTWRSSMNVGTLVPCLVELGLNGDDFSINLDNITRTIPSIGPLYGSYKLQIDIFECPIRLYNGLLHNNMTGIGLNMAQVKLPKIRLTTVVKNRKLYHEDLNTSQISKSSLIHYLGLSGLADAYMEYDGDKERVITRKINAVPLLAYWDIYKNYYANKQEEKGAMIAANPDMKRVIAKKIVFWDTGVNQPYERKLKDESDPDLNTTELYVETENYWETEIPENGFPLGNTDMILIGDWNHKNIIIPSDITVVLRDITNAQHSVLSLNQIGSCTVNEEGTIICILNDTYKNNAAWGFKALSYLNEFVDTENGLNIKTFDLKDIDQMRIEILKNTGLNNELLVNNVNKPLWVEMCKENRNDKSYFIYPQQGLALKTYQSDLYNNWLQTEWIDGTNGINKITAIDTSSGSFEIDALILSKKIYNMLNRIAVSGGSYEDWQEAVYSVKANRRAETPVYRGGLSAEIMFSEVVSTTATEEDPLGTLAGKGGEHGKKGGQIEISCDEPCIIMGIVSITPRIDYSQGNSWIMTELDTMDDLHKPALDGIGFQDLLQERMAYWGTYFTRNGHLVKLAAGKIPAWLHYMTAVNETHGEFAEENKKMFMTLNRRYEYWDDPMVQEVHGITDLTTYIDPRKYNYIFADASLEAQNFWIQLGIGIKARRVMSAKIIPFA